MRKSAKTPKRQAVARFAPAKDPLNEVGNVLRWGRPTTKDGITGTVTYWRTLCNRYMIGRIVCTYSLEHRFMAFRCEEVKQTDITKWHDITIETDYRTSRPKSYRTLHRALEVVTDHLKEKIGKKIAIITNEDDILSHARRSGIDELPAKQSAKPESHEPEGDPTMAKTPKPAKTEKAPKTTAPAETSKPDVLTIKASQLIRVLMDLKLPASESYPIDKILSKAKNLPTLVEDDLPDMPKESRKILDKILAAAPKNDDKARKDGDWIRVEDDRETTPARTGKKVTKPAKGKPGKKATKSSKPMKEVQRDKFGTKMGTTAQKWNAALTKAFQSMGELMKKAKISCTRYPHSVKMIKAGHVKKDKEGKFALAK